MFELYRKHILCAAVVALCRTAHANVHADVDLYMDAMAVDRATIPESCGGPPCYFSRAIPRTIHRFHLSADAVDATRHHEAWHAYAEHLDYTLRAWGPDDLLELQALMEPALAALVREAWAAGHERFVSDVMRITVLATLGGIVVGDGLWPPQENGHWVEFSRVAPLEGLVLTTDWHGRNIRRAALFVTDQLVMAAPDHPVVRHLQRSLVANHARLSAHGLGYVLHYDAGMFALNRALAGTMTVVTIRQWDALGIFGDGAGALALVRR